MPRADAGDITVTVTGVTFNGTFTKTYQVSQDRPALEWDTSIKPVPVEVEYDGEAVEAGDLPPVKINIQSTTDNLQEYLQYSHKKTGDTAYTDGLPTNAGTYEVIVSLPEMQNFEAAVSAPITLTVQKISPIDTAPEATQPVFNGIAQALVTSGTLRDVAVRDGVVIKFSTEENGPYDTTIPTGTNAGQYTVWYQTDESENYTATPATQVQDVKIQRKQITPVVTLSEYKYLYDGGWKEPTVTVKDTDHVTVLLDTEYQVEYVNNQNVSTADNPAKVVVTDKANGNYDITRVEVPFQITSRTQETLSINNKPNTVIYGDQFTLETSGGSGNGDVTWEITGGSKVATVDPNSGQVTIIGNGSATVKATKSGTDPDSGWVNYEDAIASWTFTAAQKPVTATVVAGNKYYDGSNIATITAVVEQGVLPEDVITIQGLTGTFQDANAGEDKTVTVDITAAAISGKNSEHYKVSYSSTTVKATIYKAIAEITAQPAPASLTYNGAEQALIVTGAVVDPNTVQVEYALSQDGPYTIDFPKATNAGTYTVWYRVKETDNYTGLPAASVEATIAKKAVVATISLNPDSFVYDGTAKEPAVTLNEADGTADGTLIPAAEYTVEYRDNVNVGTATVTVTAKDDGNYSFTTVTKDFTISQKQAQVITAPVEADDPLTYNTRDQKLVRPGEASGGTMVYSTDNANNAKFEKEIPTGRAAGEYTVYYKVEGDANHSDSAVGSVKVTIAPKAVNNPVINLSDEKGPLDHYTYDGTAKKPTAVVLDGSTLIDATEYNVVYNNNIDAGTATVNLTDKPDGNYIVSGSATFVIVKADIAFSMDPAAASITYDGKAHELLIPGETSGGEVQYALNSATSTYTAAIPTATEAGNYTVYYKVVGDKNHNDYAVKSIPVTIQRKPLTDISIELTPDSFVYDGQVKLPEVTVKFTEGKTETVVPKTEYDWSCNNTAPTDEGTYTITISDATGGNYDLSNVATKTATFTIGKIPQDELVIEGKPTTTNYGDSFQLTVSGGSANANGTISWSAEGPATVNSDGNVTINDVGEVTITVKKAASTNYYETQAQWSFTATPRPVTASVTVDDKAYDGTTSAAVTAATITTVNSDTVTIDPDSITATFDTPTVGTGKTVTLDTSKAQVTGKDEGKYEISYPDTATADITKETTTITKQPAGIASLEYNGQPQALVTAGETNVGFLVYSLDGTNFSPEIPTGTNAGAYTVHYKVDGTADYSEVTVKTVPVTIQPKAITPTVTPSTSSFLYDGTKKEPVIVLKDGKTVIDEDQYTVAWTNDNDPTATDVLTDAGTYTATIASVANGNYTFTATAKATITKAAQSALKITGKPSHVYYGDTVTTLDTTGGSGNGTVKWSIEGGGNATIDSDTGELTVKDTGSITVKAERTVPNYETVSDTWTFTVEPKPVTAVVTVTRKVYDGDNSVDDADIEAVVKASDLVATGDTITISGLKGTYDDANVGTDKTVTLDSTNATVNVDTGKYTVSYPATAKADITPKAVTVTVTLSGNDLQTDPDGNDYYVYNGGARTPTVTVTADDGAVLAASDYSVSYSNNQNVGTATVTVTNTADGNYTFPEKEENFDIREADAVLTSTPRAKDLTYNGTMQDLVTVGTASGGTVVYSLAQDGTYTEAIPQEDEAGTYTVYYMVKGDANHGDTTPSHVSVTIKPKEVISPKITVTGSYTYDGSEQKPAGNNVTVEDGSTTIPDTEYTLSYQNNINAGTAMVIVINANGGNYIVNGTATFEIAKASAAVATAPAPQTLKYNGTVQELVTAGSASNGTMVYSLDQNGEYSPAIPTRKDVGNYTVWYKVKGDDNHNDSAEQSVSATITKNTVTAPTIQVTPETVTYNGKQQTPKVSVKDDQGVAIDGSEYTVAYADDKGNTDLTAVGKYTLTITEVSGGNYTFDRTSGNNTATFEILPAGQTPLTITGTREHVYYGDTIQLGTTGGNGTVTWDVGGSTIASITADGRLTITGVGPVTVTATSKATGYNDQTATWPIHVEKKPVTAVVTATAKTYDGTTNADVTATLQSSDLVGSDSVTIDLPGSSFEDANAGTDKKVNVNSKTPDFAGSTVHENYNITYPATTTASIFKANIDQANVTAPTEVTGLTYTGKPQALATVGSSTEGTMEYSLDNKSYSVSLPTGTDAGDYEVWYRVKGDSNHNDTAGAKLDDKVTIAKQAVTAPIIEFIPSGAAYNGSVQRPVVVVKDANGRVIPDSEYTVAYGSTDWTIAGTHKVTVTGKTEGNYNITETEGSFTITPMGQNPLSITNQPGKVQYGDSFTLSATGGSGTGTVDWVSTNPEVASIDQNGLVTTNKAGGPVTITATKQGDGNFGTVTASWTFRVEPKPVTPIVTAKDREYDPDNDTASLVITWNDGDLLKGDSITLSLSGKFDNPNAGNDKQVTITGTAPSSDKYEITLPTTTTASITPKAASVTGVTVSNNLIYNGSAQTLVSGGTATGGDPAYSQDGDYYTLLPPKETNAGTYPVWYKAKANSGNYTDSPAMRVDVTIQPKSVTSPTIELSNESFEYDGTEKRPDVVVKDGNIVIPASEYTVSYSNNVAVGNNTAKVTINDAAGGNYTVSGTKTFTIKAGEASLETPPEPKDLTYTGSAQALVTPGTAVNGRVVYSSEHDGTYTTTIPRKTDAGDYEVWYKVKGNNGASDTEPNFVTVTIKQKQVTPTILLNHQYAYSTPYTGSARTPDVTVIVDGQQLPPGSFSPIYSNNKDVGTATVTVQNIGGNYQFFAVATFEITKGKATFLLEPEGESDLFYTGEPQQLVTIGAARQPGLLVLYSLDGVTYSTSIPTGTDTGDYIVFAKVQGNAMYEESDVVAIRVKIGVNNVTNPGVALSSSSFHYTGGEHKPTVTVTDDRGRVIPASEYTVSYSDNINVGEATVTVTSKGSNYSFRTEAKFRIVPADQSLLTITGKRDSVYYGDMLQLGTTGGSGNGAVDWTATGPVTKLSDGQFKITNSGSVTITATKAASDNYAATSDTWTFYANPKPVTATVMAADKPYDNNPSAKLTVTINSGLVSGDVVTTVQATGHFTDANVGQNKTVIIDSLTIPDDVSKKYDIGYNATTTASITPKAATVTSEPVKVANTLTYNGSQQNLLTSGGTADGGDLAYSLDGKNYSFNLPTAKDAGNYTVWYKVVAADENHKDSVPGKLEKVVIAANADRPTVLCTPATFQYDGTEKTPAVVVRDSANRVIPESEYTVSLPANRIAVGSYTVTVTDNPGGNYAFSDDVTGTFEIVAASQNPLSIVTDKPRDIYYGDSFRLSAMGGSGSGAIHWSIEGSAATISTDGVVTISGTGGFTVKAYREAADGYSNSNTDSVPFVAHPKPVTPVVTAKDKPYDGNTDAELKATWKSGDLVGSDKIDLTVTGEFVTADVGTNKQVGITLGSPSGEHGNYFITWPDSTTASISRVDAKLDNKPAAPDLTYTGTEQALVTAGTTVGNIATIEYSLSQNGVYSTDIPKATNASKYTVWYKVADSVNYMGIPAAPVEVEIKKATPTISTAPTASGSAGQKLSEIQINGGAVTVSGTFAWKDGSIQAVNGTSYDVVFTPVDKDNYNEVTIQVQVSIPSTSGGGTTTSAPMQTTVQNGAANTVLSTAGGRKLVSDAIANQSESIVIKPEITGEVTKAQVSIPSSTVSQIKNETNASLTVSVPIADVTIPNTALDTLGSAGGTVNVMAEQVDQSVVLKLTADGKNVESVPGGVKLTVSAEDAGPGTVAVLVHEDGTREIVRKSLAGDGKVDIPLNGSATVEIVDNSKEFADVPDTNWAADAVDFASAHEMFNGTSETTFSPDETMSRGMLATVLYNLEGCPEQEATGGFGDVSSDDWYADSIAWAVENGIADGYGDGQFGPNDNITREQLAVILWKYAGSPKASGQDLAFTDADQASGYAQEALCWAVEKGILNGYNGQLSPKETATRAQAAQMLKSFMENA